MNDEKCPGEEVCTTDRLQGECARLNRSLEQWCKPDGCRLYYTKKGTTPQEFAGLYEAAVVCRARQKAGLDLVGYPLPYWAEKAHLIGSAVFNQVENSVDDEENDDEKSDFQIKGKGDSGAFNLIHQTLIEQRARIKDDG